MNEENLERILGLFPESPPSIGPERSKVARPVAELEAEIDSVFSQGGGSDELRDLVRAIILLAHDHLEESHAISQNIPGAEGSMIHGIMHRREMDYSNAKYWFRRVELPQAFVLVLALASRWAESSEKQRKLVETICPNGKWDPFAFIDACERSRHGGPYDGDLLRLLQGFEIIGLLKHTLSLDGGSSEPPSPALSPVRR